METWPDLNYSMSVLALVLLRRSVEDLSRLGHPAVLPPQTPEPSPEGSLPQPPQTPPAE